MATTVPVPATVTMRPYREQGKIDYARLAFDPDERELPPDAMEQEPAVQELLGLLASRCTDFGQRPDTFLSSNTILCYDPADSQRPGGPGRVPGVWGGYAGDPPAPALPALGSRASRRTWRWRWRRPARRGKT